MGLESFIREKAHRLGFAAIGFAAAGPGRSFAGFEEWLARGYAGDMAWLAQNAALRAQPALLAPYVKTIIAVAAPYPSVRRSEHWSNYALGLDYHDVLRGKLKELAEAIRKEVSEPLLARACVDSAPLLEPEWACRAGLGWIGRQGSLVHPELGCCLFLGELLINLELEASSPVANQCGDCRLCVEACPAGAIQADGLVDARRCVAYLTIEHKGEIPAEFQPMLGKSLFGCDRCTAVCPWNRQGTDTETKPGQDKQPTPNPSREGKTNVGERFFHQTESNNSENSFKTKKPTLLPTLEGHGATLFKSEFASLREFRGSDSQLPSPADCLAMTETEFERRFSGTAIQRLGLARLQRNAQVVIHNQRSQP